jgi:uncharacterized lipoprotein YddW (UPF0748 family)
MDRRDFLRVTGFGLIAAPIAARAPAPLPALAPPPAPLKHWAWLRGGVTSVNEWRRTLAGLREIGIGAVLIGGAPDFFRAHVPPARDEGVEVHAWLFTMMRAEHVKTHPEWYAVNRKGVSTAEKPPYVDYYRFLCPSRDAVRESLRGVVRELATIDGLAGVHLDYIRYPDVILPVALWPKYGIVQDREYPDYDYCYCGVCRDRFKYRTGVDPLELPDPAGHAAWLQYRYDTISEVVALLADEVHAQRKLLTAAVFPTPAIARALVRQDWTRWKVDAVLPMVYHGFYKEDVAWIERATREGVTALNGRIPLYSGLYVPDLPPADLARAARYALAGGAQGISVFQGDMLTPEHRVALESLTRLGVIRFPASVRS